MNLTTIPTMNNTMIKKKKTSQGRKKIDIKKIEDPNPRQVTFSKRRSGLFKKASELCILTGAHVAILVNSPGGHIFTFGHPNVDVIIDRYLNNTNTTNNNNNNNNNNNVYRSEGSTSQKPQLGVEFNQHYMEVSKELEAEKRRSEAIQQSKALNSSGGILWYEEEVDAMEAEELEQYLSALVELKRKVLVRADELTMINKTPVFLGPYVSDNVGGVGFTNEVYSTMINPGNVMAPTGYDFGFGYNCN